MTDTSEFDWHPDGEDAEDIIVRHQPAIAIYTNPRGDVVIRQEGHYGPEEDQFVYVSPDNALKVAQKLLDVAGIDVSIAEPLTEPLLLPAPSKGAARSRRYRQRKRDGGRDADVTQRDADFEAITEEPALRLIAAE